MNLKELSNVELCELAFPAIKQICENIFYRDDKQYTLTFEEIDLLNRLYDMCLDYEYSKLDNKYIDEDNEGELLFIENKFQSVRVKLGRDKYKQEKWLEVYNKLKEKYDEKISIEFRKGYVETPCHKDRLYYLNSIILSDYLIDEKEKSYNYLFRLLDNDFKYVINNIDKFPLAVDAINEICYSKDEEEMKYFYNNQENIEESVYIMLKLFNYYLYGYKDIIKKNEDIAKRIIMNIFKYEDYCDGRQSLVPYIAFSKAYYELGKCYENGILFEQNYDYARYCYVKAGKNTKPLHALGDMYLYGKGCDVDCNKAMYYYNASRRIIVNVLPLDHNMFYQELDFINMSDDEYEKRLAYIRENNLVIDENLVTKQYATLDVATKKPDFLPSFDEEEDYYDDDEHYDDEYDDAEEDYYDDNGYDSDEESLKKAYKLYEDILNEDKMSEEQVKALYYDEYAFDRLQPVGFDEKIIYNALILRLKLDEYLDDYYTNDITDIESAVEFREDILNTISNDEVHILYYEDYSFDKLPPTDIYEELIFDALKKRLNLDEDVDDGFDYSRFNKELLDKTNKSALKIIKKAINNVDDTTNIILSMYKAEYSLCQFLFKEYEISTKDIVDAIEKCKNEEKTYKINDMLLDAYELAENGNISEEHLFVVVVKYDKYSQSILKNLGLDYNGLIDDICEIYDFSNFFNK